MSLEAKKFLDNKQEEHFKQFGVYADVNSKLAEWMQEYKDKTIMNVEIITVDYQIYLLPYLKITTNRFLNGRYELIIGWLNKEIIISI